MPLPNDLRRLRDNGSASAAELSEFLGQLRGKRPQEVLGLVAASGLAQGMGLSAAAAVLLLAVLTVVPYAWGKVSPAEKKRAAKAPAAETASPVTAEAQPAGQPAPSPTAPPSAVPAAGGGADEAQRLLDRLDEAEIKDADPLSNPLEDKADDLLKDIK